METAEKLFQNVDNLFLTKIGEVILQKNDF